jgi:hypothetical protein
MKLYHRLFALIAGSISLVHGQVTTLTTSEIRASELMTLSDEHLCETGINIIYSCELAFTAFDSLAKTDQAACLCYSNSDWFGDSFDKYWNDCISIVPSSMTAQLLTDDDFCSSYGNFLSEPTMTTQSDSTNTGLLPAATITSPTTVTATVTTTVTVKSSGSLFYQVCRDLFKTTF